MKTCKYSASCYYGNAFHKNQCAYNENLNEYDVCPYLLENWDYIIDELTKERKSGNNVKNVL